MKFVDEEGNPIDPADLDDYEAVEIEAAPPVPPAPVAPVVGPAVQPTLVPHTATEAPATATNGGRLWLVVAVVVVVIALAVCGVFALRGRPAPGPSVADRVASKTNAVKQTATEKRDEVTHPPIDVCSDLSKAQLDKTVSIGSASMRLRVVHSAPLPSQAATALNGDASKLQLLQLGAGSWGVYLPQPQQNTAEEAPTAMPKQTWWKVPVDTADNNLKVGAAVSWPGGDADAAGACPAGDPGAYAVVGDVPADAKGLREGQAEVLAIKGDASTAASTTGAAATITAAQDGSQNRVLAVMGSSVVVATLEYAPEQTAPSTTTEGR